MFNEDFEYHVNPAKVESDDVNQEIILYKIKKLREAGKEVTEESIKEFKDVKRQYFYLNQVNQVNDVLLVDNIPEDCHQVEWADYNVSPSYKVIKRLYEWSLEQKDTQIQALMNDFLSYPTEEKLGEFMLYLKEKGILANVETPKDKTHSASDMILTFLKHHPKSKKEIIEHISGIITSKRPAATARQALRKLVRKGLIIELDDEHYEVKS